MLSSKNKPYAKTIRSLLRERAADASICPSEVARRLAGRGDWRKLMEPVRKSARKLARKKQIIFTQKGVVKEPQNLRGPIRLARGSGFF